jgi:hypothetical protein
MMRRVLVIVLAAGLAGCGWWGSAGSGSPATAPATAQAATKKAELPAEYATVAAVLARPLGDRPDAAIGRRGMAEMIAAAKAGVMDLKKIKTADGDLNDIAQQGAAGLDERARRLQALDGLPKPPGGDAWVAAVVHGLPGSPPAFSGGGAGQRGPLVDALRAYAAASDQVVAAQLLLGKVAAKYAPAPLEGSGPLGIDFDEAALSGQPEDLCAFVNTGEAMKDCTLRVTLVGEGGAVRENLHYLKEWAANGKWYGAYPPGADVEGKLVGARSVANVERVEVTLWSPGVMAKETYAYLGAERDKDVEAWAKSLKLTGRYQPFVAGLFAADVQRGIRLTLAEGPAVGKCWVDLTFTGGGVGSKTWTWELSSWAKGEEKTFSSPPGGLNADPSQVEVVMRFPRSGYKRRWVFNIKV